MIGEYRRLSEQTTAQRHAGRVKLRQVHLYNIMLCHEFRCNETEGGGNDTLANACRDRYTDDLYAIDGFFTRQGRLVLGGHNRHLMFASGKGAREPFSVNGETGCMRAIVCQYSKDSHKAGRL